MKVAVVGASGFVGSAVAEALWFDDPASVIPLIHSSGNAWQLARHGMPLTSVDVLSKARLADALAGCSHVVNCFRAGGDRMTKGLSNLLEAARSSGVRHFIHLSSVAVYGARFDGQTIDEQCPTRAEAQSYGSMKGDCDRLVNRAARRGLRTTLLCPPNISGANSPFLLNIIAQLRLQKVALVEDGALPCELIDVQNLVHAIRLALVSDGSDGSRFFVTDQQPQLTWRMVLEDLARIARVGSPLHTVSSHAAEAAVRANRKPDRSVTKAFKRPFSADVIKALRQDPIWDSTMSSAVRLAKRLPTGLQRWIKSNGAQPAPKPASSAPSYAVTILDQQLRNVRYSNNRATQAFGYQPLVTYEESMRSFSDWADRQFGWASPMGDLFLAAAQI